MGLWLKREIIVSGEARKFFEFLSPFPLHVSSAISSPLAFLCRLAAADTNPYAPPVIYEDAIADWEKQFPQFAKYGWGPSAQAEKWNGRHAMFGWFFICATAYCKGHGLIPDPETALDLKKWGTLAIISGKDTISNERAIILAANMHFFAISLMAAFCPLPFGDSLFTEYGEGTSSKGMGYLPALKFGLTEEAEIINGRLAMVGLTALIVATAVEQKDMLGK